jgi:hypothetical protein
MTDMTMQSSMDATTLSITTFSITTLSMNDSQKAALNILYECK